MISHAELEWMIEDHHKRWDVSSPELGASLHAMRQLGHWRPFTRASRKLYAEIIAFNIEPVTEHQQSRRVGPPTQENDDAPRHNW